MEKTIEFIKLQVEHLLKESGGYNGKERYSHGAWTKRLQKGITPCDYSKEEKLIEVEFEDGNRYWFTLGFFFGKVIEEAKTILMLCPDGKTEILNIVGIDLVKIKRTMYWKLIFERDLPYLTS